MSWTDCRRCELRIELNQEETTLELQHVFGGKSTSSHLELHVDYGLWKATNVGGLQIEMNQEETIVEHQHKFTEKNTRSHLNLHIDDC